MADADRTGNIDSGFDSGPGVDRDPHPDHGFDDPPNRQLDADDGLATATPVPDWTLTLPFLLGP